MPLTPQITAAQVPPGTCFPPNFQLLLDQVASNLIISGLDSSTFFSFGPTTPPTDAQGGPWFKTDANYGLLGIYTFAGGAWTPALSPFMTGMIIPNFLNPPPNSDPWFYCDGTQGARGFTTPDLRGRFLVNTGQRTLPTGSTDSATNFTLGLAGGGETTTIAAANIPAHIHDALAAGAAPSTTPSSKVYLFNNEITQADAVNGLVTGGNTTGVGPDGVTPSPPTPTPILNPYFGIPMYMFIAPAFP